MAVYLFRRLLLMVPTFFGISMLIWLVMAFAPGKPTAGGGGADMGADPSALDPNRDQGERFFREQFGLNRPLFWNGWTTLGKDEVRSTLQVVQEGPSVHGMALFRRQRDLLMDWGRYSVPPLLDLLDETQGALQTFALAWLKYAATHLRSLYAAGHMPTAEEEAADARLAAENKRLQRADLTWSPDATPEQRAPVVAAWKAWFAERRGEWELSWGERVGRGIGDTQFGRYWGNLARLDLGLSSRERKPVGAMIRERLVYSLTLAVPSFLLAWVLAVLLGVASATHHRKLLDHGIGLGLFVLYSLPVFAVGTVLQQVLAQEMHLFPVSDFDAGRAATARMGTWAAFKDVLWHITLPLVCYTYGSLAYISRQARSGMLEVLKSDYVRTARAKGLSEQSVVWRHAVRNGMMPVVTLLGTALPVLIGGSIPIEYIFNIDGFGLLILNSIQQKDYNVVMGIELIVAALTLVGMLITDMLYAAMDPRISYE